MNLAVSYLKETFIVENTNDVLKHKESIKKNLEFIKKASDELKGITDKNSKTAKDLERTIEFWKSSNAKHQEALDSLTSGKTDGAEKQKPKEQPKKQKTMSTSNPSDDDSIPSEMSADSSSNYFKHSKKDHPLNFGNSDEYLDSQRSSAYDSDEPSEYKESLHALDDIDSEEEQLKSSNSILSEILDNSRSTQDEKNVAKKKISDNNLKLKDIDKRRSEVSSVIKSHEKKLKSDFYKQHESLSALKKKASELNAAIDLEDSKDDGDSSDARDELEKVSNDISKILGKKTVKYKTPSKIGNNDDASDETEQDDESNVSTELAKKTAEKENKYNKDSKAKQHLKTAANAVGSILGRIGSGLKVQDNSITDIVKDSKTRQALVAGFDKLSDAKKEFTLKRIKKPFDAHIAELTASIEQIEKEVKKLEAGAKTSIEKTQLQKLNAKLKQLKLERDKSQETYDEIVKSSKNESFNFCKDKAILYLRGL